MPSKLTIRHRGLYTWPNPLSEIPEGGLLLANNVVIDREGTIEPRRGYSELEYPLGYNPDFRADQLITFGFRDLIAHYGDVNAPSRMAFFTRVSESSGTLTAFSTTISDLPSTANMYVGQYVKPIPRETIFLGNQTLGSNIITGLLSSQGIFAGMAIGGLGIPENTTVLNVFGSGPYSLLISNNALFTQVGNTLTVTDSNIAGIVPNTQITSIDSTTGSITISNSAANTSRSLTFSPAAVDDVNDIITIPNHGMVESDQVQFTSTGTLPAPLTTGAIYHVVQSASGNFKISTTSGGTPIDITDQGTGTHTIIIRDDFTFGGWVDYPGPMIKPEATVKMRYAELNNSLYFTTEEGIRVIDKIDGITFKGDVTYLSDVIDNIDILDVNIGEYITGAGIPDGTYVVALLSQTSIQISNVATLTAVGQTFYVQPRLAGIPPALDGEAWLTTDVTGFLDPYVNGTDSNGKPLGAAVGYKIVWGRKNVNDRVYIGAPSTTIVVSNNTTDKKNVELQFSVPAEITCGYFYRIYRGGFSASANSIPQTDFALIHEASPTYDEINNELVLFKDNVPESLRTGPQLYTNDTQEGALLANYTPPFATDLTAFKGSLFLSNTKTKHVLNLTINSVSGQFSILADTVASGTSAFKSKTLSNPTLNITGDVTSGSEEITNINSIDMAAIAIGQTISGPGIPDGTKVAYFEDTSTIGLTKAATATTTGATLTLEIVGVRVGQTVLGSNIPTDTVLEAIFSASTATANTTSGDPMVFNFPLGKLDVVQIGQPISATSGIPSGTLVEEIYTSLSHPFVAADVDAFLNQFTLLNHGFVDGNVVTFTGSSLPAPLTAGTNYYIINATTNTFKVSTSYGGAEVNITSVGSGVVERSNQLKMTDNATASLTGVVVTFGLGGRMSQGATTTVSGATITFKNSSPGLTPGIEAGDTITIAGVEYTAATTEDYTGVNRNFKVFAHGSPAQNISDTAASLIRVINRQQSASGNPNVYAFDNSIATGLVGNINIIARTVNTAAFTAFADSTISGLAYTPNLPGPGGTSVVSQNDEMVNGLAWSKSDMPEAFPLGYNAPIGSEKEDTLRIIALRDSLFILKRDGVYRMTGTGPTDFRSTIFDNTIKLAAPESAQTLSNTIFCLSTEGVVSISDSNVQIMSRPIENLILDAFEASQVKVRTMSFGIPYTSDRKYILFTIKSEGDLQATQAFVYNTFTNSWTVWNMSQTCGVVLSDDDLLYLGRSDLNTLKVERKNRNYTDYIDGTFTQNIVGLSGVVTLNSNQITLILPNTLSLSVGQSISGTGIPSGTVITSIQNNFTLSMSQKATLTGIIALQIDNSQQLLLDDTNRIHAGDVLFQNDGRFVIITDVNKQKNTIKTRVPINTWTLGEATILQAIPTDVKYAPQVCGNPAAIKQITQFIGLFQSPVFDTIYVTFSTDISSSEESVALKGSIGGLLWGLYPWGEVIWGGIPSPIPLRTYLPQQKQRCTQLNVTITHREAYAYYRLSGIDLYHGTSSERVRR